MFTRVLCALLSLTTFSSNANAQHVIDKKDYESMAFLSARMGRTAEAIRYFDKAIEKSPEDYSLYMNRATAFLNMSQPKKALVDLEKAGSLMKGKKIPPFMESGYLSTQGDTYSALGRLDEAIASLKRSISLFPMNAATHATLGRLYAKQGDKKSGIEQLKLARKLYPAGYNLSLIDSEIAELEGKKKPASGKGPTRATPGKSSKNAVKTKSDLKTDLPSQDKSAEKRDID